jgi:hypothetical protein
MQDVLEEIRGYLATDLTTKCNKYFAGRVKNPPANYLPCCSVYAEQTEVRAISTGTDRATYTIHVEVITGVLSKDGTAGIEATSIAAMQKNLVEIMEKRTSGIPDTTSVVGSIRKRLAGTNYLFNGNLVINYEQEIRDKTFYFRGNLTFQVQTTEKTRPV